MPPGRVVAGCPSEHCETGLARPGPASAALQGSPLQAGVERLGRRVVGTGGPLALRRVPPDAYTLTARLDILTAEQHLAVAGATRHHSALTNDEATVLLAAIGVSRWPPQID